MNNHDINNLIAQWNRLGVLYGGASASQSPDLERLLLDTARCVAANARLFYLVITWLSAYSNFVARHRLKFLIQKELETEYQPALGALLGLSIKHGASKELLIAADSCKPAERPSPLFEVHLQNPTLTKLARNNASEEGLKWNLWLPDQLPKYDALRPAHWIIKRNPDYLNRIIRKGDLRVSILLTLQYDIPNGCAESETALARLCAANRLAVRNSLDDLQREGYQLRRATSKTRNTSIILKH